MPMPDQLRVFSAWRVITMNPLPFATQLAVRQGRILGVGTQDQMSAFGPAVADDRFASKVILPGFVEGHSHLFKGLTWCLVPGSRDATLTREAEEALWQAAFTAQPEQRREFEPSSKRRKKRPAPWPSATA